METLTVNKVSAGCVFKLIGIGLTFGFLPIFLLFGILGAAELGTLTWNMAPVIGLKAIFVAPLLGLFMALIFTGLLGSVAVFGLWIFSKFSPITIEYEELAEELDELEVEVVESDS